MSEPSPQVIPTADGSALTAAAAEELIRRAVAIDAERSRLVTLAQLKATLAPLGIPDKTVERAAAEVKHESRRNVSRKGIVDWIMALLGYAILALPGVFLIWLGLGSGLLGTLILGWMGATWLLFVLGAFLDVAHEDRQIRRSQELDALV